ncbi:MAG: glycosyltransferase [Gammaproteobacteria bacterium]
MAKVLYISYDGVLEPLGQSQVLNYLKILSSEHDIYLLTFEKKTDLTSNNYQLVFDECKEHGIEWVHLDYHKSLLGTYVDIIKGLLISTYICFKKKVNIIHSRSYLPSLIAFLLKKTIHTKFIFDMRGLWADEKVDSGVWDKSGFLYKIVKSLEKVFLLNADKTISLTESGKKEILSFDYLRNKDINLSVIRTCTDLDLFKTNVLSEKKDGFFKNKFVLGYVGSVSLWYDFPRAILFFKYLLEIKENSVFYIINKGEHAEIKEMLNNHSLSEDSYIIESKTHSNVPLAMQRMDAGIFFLESYYSKVASAPTKLGEFLAMGLPCVTNKNIGDVDLILEGTPGGLVLNNFDTKTLEDSVKKLIELTENEHIADSCRKIAKTYFSLKEGATIYSKFYKDLC